MRIAAIRAGTLEGAPAQALARDLHCPRVRQLRGPRGRTCAWIYRAHARRLYATVTDPARVAAALLATKLTRGRLVSPFTAREVYRNEWTGLTEARVVQGALECLEELGWIRPEAVRGAGGRPTRRFHLNPRLGAVTAGRSRGSSIPHLSLVFEGRLPLLDRS